MSIYRPQVKGKPSTCKTMSAWTQESGMVGYAYIDWPKSNTRIPFSVHVARLKIHI